MQVSKVLLASRKCKFCYIFSEAMLFYQTACIHSHENFKIFLSFQQHNRLHECCIHYLKSNGHVAGVTVHVGDLRVAAAYPHVVAVATAGHLHIAMLHMIPLMLMGMLWFIFCCYFCLDAWRSHGFLNQDLQSVCLKTFHVSATHVLEILTNYLIVL